MKKKRMKLLAFMMVLCLALPVLTYMGKTVPVMAASAALNVTSKKVYLGTTYQLQLKNVDTSKVSKIQWKANRSSIAKVNQEGLVTPVAVGTTTVKCTLTYKDGQSTVLSCKIVVRKRVAATAVKITNASLGNRNAQSIYVGEKFTIKKTVTPSGTTDSAFYLSYDESIATVSTSGVITAKAPGITMIEIRYGTSRAEAMSADNTAVARLFVDITEKPAPTPTPTLIPTPTPTPAVLEVTDVTMTGSQEVQITFSNPVLKSSLINGTKLAAGTVIIGADSGASDSGTLTPNLSKDRKKLTLSASGTFNGTYSVLVSNKVQADNGASFTQFATVLSMKDTTGPVYQYTSVGYTGWVSSINYNETLDISGMTVDSVSGTTDAALMSYLQDVSNYKLSADKKSIEIDLSSYTINKSLAVRVTLKGIRDTAGNATSQLLQQVFVRTDASEKPLAQIVKTERTSRSEIQVTFSSAIFSPGIAIFGSSTTVGIVNAADPTIVTYEIPSAYQGRTGIQLVVFNNWYNYNTTTVQNTPVSMAVDFTLDTTPPKLIKYEMVNGAAANLSVCKLILTYDKEIAFASTSQSIAVKVKNSNGNISTLSPISMSATVEGYIVTYMFTENAMMENGEFTIALPAGMVADKLNNFSTAAQIYLSKNGSNTGELPAPNAVEQDTTDLNTIYVSFANKLDLATAEQIQNYHLATIMKYPIAATVVSQNENNAVVALTFASGTFTGSINSYELVINGVKGYNNTYGAISDCHVIFTALENTPPALSGAIRMSYGTITMTMSETVTGSLKVTATDVTTGASINGTGYATGNLIYISLETTPSSSSVRFVITENNVTDTNGNKAALMLNQSYIAIQS